MDYKNITLRAVLEDTSVKTIGQNEFYFMFLKIVDEIEDMKASISSIHQEIDHLLGIDYD